jgi:hypothetical protein
VWRNGKVSKGLIAAGLSLALLVGIGLAGFALPGVGLSGSVTWDGWYYVRATCNTEAGYLGYDLYGVAGSLTNLGFCNVGDTKTFFLDVSNGTTSYTIRKFGSSDGIVWTSLGGTNTADRKKTQTNANQFCAWSIVGIPGNVIVNQESGLPGAHASWVEPTVSDPHVGSGIAATLKTAAPGVFFPIGTTTVIYTWTPPVTPNFTKTCSFTVTVNPVVTYTITASADAHGSISPSGTVVVDSGANQQFLITADPHYHIADVLVDGSSIGAVTSYTFTNVTAAHTISASFAIDTYTILASAGSNGSISPSGSMSVDYGADQSFTITPDAKYLVADVVVDGSSAGAASSYVFADVTENHTVSATFVLRDRTAPEIMIVVPGDGAVYPVNAVVLADWIVTDADGTVATIEATTPSGSPIATTPGAHTFTVTATDDSGNTGSVTVTYRVAYTMLPGFPPAAGGGGSVGDVTPSYIESAAAGAGGANEPRTVLATFSLGDVVQVAFVLEDGAGAPVFDAVATLSVVCVAFPGDGSETYNVLLPAYVFAYDAAAGRYVAGFSTEGVAPGIYDLWIGANDGSQRVIRIEIAAR